MLFDWLCHCLFAGLGPSKIFQFLWCYLISQGESGYSSVTNNQLHHGSSFPMHLSPLPPAHPALSPPLSGSHILGHHQSLLQPISRHPIIITLMYICSKMVPIEINSRSAPIGRDMPLLPSSLLTLFREWERAAPLGTLVGITNHHSALLRISIQTHRASGTKRTLIQEKTIPSCSIPLITRIAT